MLENCLELSVVVLDFQEEANGHLVAEGMI
jgi:hypothetical protein